MTNNSKNTRHRRPEINASIAIDDTDGTNPKIPITIFTGFLGSGKSSLIRNLLAHPTSTETAVVINELGNISIDHALLDHANGDIVQLAHGCLCCTLRSDLAGALSQLCSAARQNGRGIRRVFVETTGLADPVPILQSFTTDSGVFERFRLLAVVCTFDLVLGESLSVRYHELSRQLSFADRIVLTKGDLVDRRTLRRAVEIVRSQNPHAELLLGRNGATDSGWWVSDAADSFCQFTKQRSTTSLSSIKHGDGVASLSVAIAQSFTWEILADVLAEWMHCAGVALLRLKGLVNVTGVTGPVVIHGIQHVFFAPEFLAHWPDHDDRTKLVFITDGLERDLLLEPLRTRGLDFEIV